MSVTNAPVATATSTSVAAATNVTEASASTAPVALANNIPGLPAAGANVARNAAVFVPRSGATWIGWTMALVATFCFSTATPIARAALVGGMDPYALLAGRMTVTLVLMALTILLTNPKRLAMPKNAIYIAIGAGLLNSVGLVSYFLGLIYLEASMAAMIISLSPLVLLSILAMRGERVTFRHVIRMLLALAGVYLLIGPSGEVSIVGVLYILGAIIAFAIQTALLQWYLTEYDGLAVTFYILVSMTVGILAWWMVKGMPWQDPGMIGWAAILGSAVVGTFIARVLHFSAVTRIGGGQVSMLSPMETLLAVLWAYLFLDERLYPIQLIGGALILLSAVLAIQRLRRGRRRLRWRVWART